MTSPNVLVPLVLVLALAGASVAGAQEGSPGGDQRPDGEVRQFEDWAIECREPQGSGAKSCVMFQRQVLKDGRTLLLMSVQYSASGGEPVAILQLPLGVLLRPGVGITVDDGETRSFSYRLCNRNGCIVSFPLNEEIKTRFQRGGTARVAVTTGDGRTLGVEISLQGFTAALDALTK